MSNTDFSVMVVATDARLLQSCFFPSERGRNHRVFVSVSESGLVVSWRWYIYVICMYKAFIKCNNFLYVMFIIINTKRRNSYVIVYILDFLLIYCKSSRLMRCPIARLLLDYTQHRFYTLRCSVEHAIFVLM